MRKKRLLIDVNSIVPYYVSGRVNGIGRTTMELVHALAELKDLPFEVMLYSQNIKGIGGKNINLPFKNKHFYIPNREIYNKMLAATPIQEWLTRYDIKHIPHNFGYTHCPEKTIVTIHDAMFFSNPEQFHGHDFARKNYPKLAQRAKAIITCSQNSKNEIAEYMDIPEEKIHVCHWGVDRNIFYPHTPKPNKYTSGHPFFFSISCNIGRKNTISILRAYEKFIQNYPSHDLVLVWNNPSSEIKDKYSKGIFAGRIHFVSGISNKELSDLYAEATATFFPSKYEGFGLPVLESMACGTPIITCNNSSLGEVGGNTALYVEPEDVATMAQWMETFENKSIDRDALVNACLQQAEKFTWEACALKTVEVYKKCLDL